MKFYVHYKLVVEVDTDHEQSDSYPSDVLDEVWDKATDTLRGGGGDITGHTIVDDNGAVSEDCGI